MNKYDTEFIKAYIEEHQSEIEFVACGIKEDWDWTSDVVWAYGKFVSKFNWNSKSIEVAGIKGSIWGTPVMRVEFKDGNAEVVPCFFEDGNSSSASEINEAMAFAYMTGATPLVE